MTMRGYARMSGLGQDLKIQIDALKGKGCDVIYQEKFTGMEKDRPEFYFTLEKTDYFSSLNTVGDG